MIEKTFVRQPRSPQSPVALSKAALYALRVFRNVRASDQHPCDSDDCTTDEARKHTVRPDERHFPISADLQHLFDRSRQTEEYNRHSAGHHDGLLETLRYQPSAPQPQEPATDNSQYIR